MLSLLPFQRYAVRLSNVNVYTIATLSLVSFAVVLMAGCGQAVSSDVIYEVVTSGTLEPGEAIPVPQDEVILTVSGKVGTTNGDEMIMMDQSSIEAVGLVEYDVHDPFEDRSIRYRGVLMSDLLALWQAAPEVEMVRFTALNDYQIDISIEDFQQYPVLFAMQADGVYMEPSYRGPAMLVYPLDDYEFDIIAIKRRWIWQIKSIELR